MKQNRYDTPEKGATDWHVPLNENFDKLERDVPVVDTEANLDSYTPAQGRLYFVTDTGQRYLGTGSEWKLFPYPSETSSPEEPAPEDPSGDVDADIVVQRDGGVRALRNGDEFTSGSAEDVFENVVGAVGDGEHIHIESGEYVVNSGKTFSNLSGVTLSSNGTVRLNDQGSRQTHLLRFDNCSDVLVDGGTYNFDKDNNVDDGKAGTQAVVQPRDVDGFEVRNATLLNGVNGLIMGGRIYNAHIHHNTMKHSDERGFYANDSRNVEVNNNTIHDVRSGCIRTRGGTDEWHLHDNDMRSRRGTFGPVYIITGGVSNVTLERETAVLGGSGTIYWDRFVGDGVTNVTVRDCEFSATDGPHDLFHLEPSGAVDAGEFDVANNDYSGIENNAP